MRTKTKIPSRKKMPEVTVRKHVFANPKERQEILMNLAISSEFEMRYRGLFEYYGKDFIAYKLENPSNNKRNEFLRILSNFMTDCLEDTCPSSWDKCGTSFWEELIFTFYPLHMKISKHEKEVENFLSQLKNFVRWLDRRAGTSWYSIVEIFSQEAVSDLQTCEHILNSLFLNDFPLIHNNDWNPEKDIEKLNKNYAECTDKLNSIFEVTSIIDDAIVLKEFNSNRIYYIEGLPCKWILPGLIMSGVIGKKSDDITWSWFQTDGIFPQRGKKYLILID